MNSHGILILLSCIVILSYLFDLLSRVTRVPSVVMLIGAGIGFKYISAYFKLSIPNLDQVLEILGTVGLILIVLEGALDLKLSQSRKSLIWRSLGAAFFSLLATSGLVALLLHQWLGVGLLRAFVNAVPFAVISSAIAIPSVVNLMKDKKEFIVYEATFSDIIGIMVFNFAVMQKTINAQSFLNFGIGLLGVAAVTIVSCLLLLFFIGRIQLHIKFFLIFALLILTYTVGKMLNLSALLLVLVFGMAIKNAGLLLKGRMATFFRTEKLDLELDQLKVVTAESAFLIRTFFFILFGYSFDMTALLDLQVMMIGSIIVVIVLAVRFIYLKFFVKGSIFPELFVAPRGLVTILLFFSIPSNFIITGFSKGVLFFVIIVTSILMMIGLAASGKKPQSVPELEELS